MAAFNFPNSPSVNDTYSANGMTFTWNGTKWERTSPSVGAQGHQGHQGNAGAQGAQGNAGAQGHQGYQGSAGSATISGNANNRVITGGSGTNLVGESNLTFTGSALNVIGTIDADDVVSIDGSSNVDLRIQTSANNRLIIRGASSLSNIITQNNNNLSFRHDGGTGGGTEIFLMDSGGIVIGNNKSIEIKDYYGDVSARLENSDSTNNSFRIDVDPDASGASSAFLVRIDSDERLRITHDGRLGINASPSVSHEYLHIKPVGNNVLDMRYELNSDTDIRQKYYDNTGTWRGGFGYTTYANSTKYPNKHDSFYWLTDPSSNGSLSTAMRLTNEGYLVKEKLPCFSVYKYDNSNQVSSGVYVFNTVVHNNGSHYNSGNGRFTAPVAGFYFFYFVLQGYGGGTGGRHVRIQLNGTDYWNQGTNTPFYDEMAGAHGNFGMGQGVQMAQGDYVTVVSNAQMRGMQSGFSGFLVG